jgi:hypothetical protein
MGTLPDTQAVAHDQITVACETESTGGDVHGVAQHGVRAALGVAEQRSEDTAPLRPCAQRHRAPVQDLAESEQQPVLVVVDSTRRSGREHQLHAVDADVDYRSLDFSILHDDSGAEGLNRLASQYLKVNIDPNERYTISLPGCLKYRLKGWESGFENLALAGDWVYSGFNVGSFEGAVMSGKLASLAVAGAPTIDHIWTYTFMNPDRKGPQHRILDRTPVAAEQPLADEDA